MPTHLHELMMADKPLSVGATAVYPYSEALMRKFTGITRFGEVYPMYVRRADNLLLPRFVCPMSAVDKRTVGEKIAFNCTLVPRSTEQTRVIKEASDLLKAGDSFILQAPTGMGKCLSPETKVLKANGNIVRADSIKVGDYLMGLKGRRKKVLALGSGYAPMYRIVPSGGKAFHTNGAHILSLRSVKTKNGHKVGDLINITVDEYLTKSDEFKRQFLAWRSAVEFPARETPGDPYMAGFMATQNGTPLSRLYIRNSRDVRLKVLEGVFGGTLKTPGTFNSVKFNNVRVASEVTYLMRSLGMIAEVVKCSVRFRDHRTYPFTVEPMGIGPYVGFVLGGDHLFLLADFTVTHNTAMTTKIIANVGRSTLIVVPKEDLIGRWREDLMKFLGLKAQEIGIIQGDKFDILGKKVVIAMLHSVVLEDRYPSWFKQSFGFVVFDECFHPSHELLTRNGWKCVADVTKDDEIAQVDGATGVITFAHPTEIISKPYTGNLVNFRSRAVDTLATPNHQHLVYWRKEEAPQKVAYGDLNPSNRWSHLLAGHVEGDGPITALDKFRIAYQADGTYLRYCSSTDEHNLRFSFRKARKVKRLLSILGGLEGARWSSSVNSRGDTNITVWVKFDVSKDLDWLPLDKTRGYYLKVLEEAVEWDGWSNEGRRFYASTMEKCVDRLQAVATLAGVVATKHAYPKDGAEHNIEYRLMWSLSGVGSKAKRRMHGARKELVPYSGMVHCVRVPKGNVLTRRNGLIVVTGNCHRLGAETFSKAAGIFTAKLRMGLSATPERQDGKEVLFYAHIGPVRVETEAMSLSPKILRFVTAWSCPRRYMVEHGVRRLVRVPHSPGKVGHILKYIATDPDRNALIVRNLLACYRKGRNHVFFSDSLDHLSTISLLSRQAGIPMSDQGMYVGGMSAKERDISSGKKLILATYKMMSEGTNIPWLDSCTFGTPRSEITQIIGRILREYEGKPPPVVFDYADYDSPVFKGYAASRDKFYANKGYKVVHMKWGK